MSMGEKILELQESATDEQEWAVMLQVNHIYMCCLLCKLCTEFLSGFS
jgi:hypothetical protein